MSTSTHPTPSELSAKGLPQVDLNENAAQGAACRSNVGSSGACCGGLGGWLNAQTMAAVAFSMLMFVVACGVHAFAVRSGVVADTAWFAIVGAAFLAITVVSHGVLCQQSAAAPLVPLMISMAIRLTGTFLILGIILKLSPLGRPEAVFNVLFWYITLTSVDLVGVVRQKNRDLQSGPADLAGPAGSAGSAAFRQVPAGDQA